MSKPLYMNDGAPIPVWGFYACMLIFGFFTWIVGFLFGGWFLKGNCPELNRSACIATCQSILERFDTIGQRRNIHE